MCSSVFPSVARPEFSGDPQDLRDYFKQVVRYCEERGVFEDRATIRVVLRFAPPSSSELWSHFIEPSNGEWDRFVGLVIQQYPELKQPGDDLDPLDELFAFLEKARTFKFDSLSSLGQYLRSFQQQFLHLVKQGILDIEAQSRLFVRGLSLQLAKKVMTSLLCWFPQHAPDLSWHFVDVVRHTRYVLVNQLVGDGTGKWWSSDPPHRIEPPLASNSHSPLRSEPSTSGRPPPSFGSTSDGTPHRIESPSALNNQHPLRNEPSTSGRPPPCFESTSSSTPHRVEPPLASNSHSPLRSEPSTSSRPSRCFESTSNGHPRPASSLCVPIPQQGAPSGIRLRFELVSNDSNSHLASSKPSPQPSSTSKSPPRLSPRSNDSPVRQGALKHPSALERFSFCFFCGREGHVRAQCSVCTSYLVSGRCRVVHGRVVLPTGQEIPREALGRTLRERLDFWALARGHGGSSSQVPSPASPQSPPGLSPPRRVHTSPPNSARSQSAQIEVADSGSRFIEHPSTSTRHLSPCSKAPVAQPFRLRPLLLASNHTRIRRTDFEQPRLSPLPSVRVHSPPLAEPSPCPDACASFLPDSGHIPCGLVK
ncbi:hypothetical protein BKA82DRAFT_4359562 [Pisolithus tinctorius]|nr:hypothetical protein BKA82DRAFT_4359562 [Pisolithus tinctorius]